MVMVIIVILKIIVIVMANKILKNARYADSTAYNNPTNQPAYTSRATNKNIYAYSRIRIVNRVVATWTAALVIVIV